MDRQTDRLTDRWTVRQVEGETVPWHNTTNSVWKSTMRWGIICPSLQFLTFFHSMTPKFKMAAPKWIGFLSYPRQVSVPSFRLIDLKLSELCSGYQIWPFWPGTLKIKVTMPKPICFLKGLCRNYTPSVNLIAIKLFGLLRRNGCLQRDRWTAAQTDRLHHNITCPSHDGRIKIRLGREKVGCFWFTCLGVIVLTGVV